MCEIVFGALKYTPLVHFEGSGVQVGISVYGKISYVVKT